jgi:hypothetical protein
VIEFDGIELVRNRHGLWTGILDETLPRLIMGNGPDDFVWPAGSHRSLCIVLTANPLPHNPDSQ